MQDDTQLKKRQSKKQASTPENVAQENQYKTKPHEYDNTLKALFGDEAAQIIPHILPGAVLLNEKNIEIDRSKLRVDLAYEIWYDGVETILNLELQTNAEETILTRLLQYHAVLHAQHRKPVASVIIYPFKTTVPAPPYEVRTTNKLLSALYYEAICLWELDAAPIVQNEIYCLYTLLPAMKGAKAELLKQALREMAERYPRHELGHRLIRFARIMRRATVMSEEEKQKVEEELRMQYAYDYFIDDNPDVQERIAKKVAEAKAEAKAEAAEMGQNMILNTLRVRFPILEQQTQDIVRNIQNPEQLENLLAKLILAQNEQEARNAFDLPETNS